MHSLDICTRFIQIICLYNQCTQYLNRGRQLFRGGQDKTKKKLKREKKSPDW